MEPGEYQIRILYDTNKNGKWDPGDYSKKLQPIIDNAINKNQLTDLKSASG